MRCNAQPSGRLRPSQDLLELRPTGRKDPEKGTVKVQMSIRGKQASFGTYGRHRGHARPVIPYAECRFF